MFLINNVGEIPQNRLVAICGLRVVCKRKSERNISFEYDTVSTDFAKGKDNKTSQKLILGTKLDGLYTESEGLFIRLGLKKGLTSFH